MYRKLKHNIFNEDNTEYFDDREPEGEPYSEAGLQSVRDWYVDSYPDDEIGEDINPYVTFEDVFFTLYHGEDIYDLLDVADSVMRERIFDRLAQIWGVEYDVIYDMWQGTYAEKRHSHQYKNYWGK